MNRDQRVLLITIFAVVDLSLAFVIGLLLIREAK